MATYSPLQNQRRLADTVTGKRRRRAPNQDGVPDIAPRPRAAGPRGGIAQPGRGGPNDTPTAPVTARAPAPVLQATAPTTSGQAVTAPAPAPALSRTTTAPTTQRPQAQTPPPAAPAQPTLPEATDYSKALERAAWYEDQAYNHWDSQRQFFLDKAKEIRDAVKLGRINEANSIYKYYENEMLARQGTDFTQLRDVFQQNLALALGRGLEGARANVTRGLGRMGIEGGLAARALGNVEARGQQQLAQSLGQFESQLLSAQQRERELFRQGGFEFITNMYAMAQQQDFQMAMARFQAELQRQAESRALYGQILGTIGQIAGTAVGFAVGGPPGAAAGAAVGSQVGAYVPGQGYVDSSTVKAPPFGR